MGEDPPDAYTTMRGRRIALDVAIIGQPARSRTVIKARLREDRVARRVLRSLESAVRAHVPNQKSIILTLGAPIKVPKQLITALTKRLLDAIQSDVEERDEKTTVLGNRVRFRILKNNLGWNAKVIGFVFSGDPAPGVIASSLRTLHDAIVAKSQRRMPKSFIGDRWLILNSDHLFADMKTYRLLYSQLSLPRRFKQILMVHDGGRVEPLA